jgi:hypothetical protein
MGFYTEAYQKLKEICEKKNITLVAVSKIRTEKDITAAYSLGQLDFGENYVQELVAKSSSLPSDIRWHFIGHLQTNKVKYIAPFIYLVHGIDNEKLLSELNRQATKNNRKINCLLQVHIAEEETKFGFSADEISKIELEKYPSLNICGLMGMATFTFDKDQIRKEFSSLSNLFKALQKSNTAFTILSMGMSSDYEIAIEEGSTLIRVGSLIFGERNA